MIRHFMSAIVLLALSLWVTAANATFTINNVSYTSNSVTFTIDGDMSGYVPNASRNPFQFSLVYGGDIWVGDGTFEPNTWSRSVFDNKTIDSVGNTGTSTNNYTWSEYTETLADAVAVNATITITMTEPDLNEGATNPQITFVWGNGSQPANYTVLETVTAFGLITEPVPSMSFWAMLVLTMLLGLLVFTHRRRVF